MFEPVASSQNDGRFIVILILYFVDMDLGCTGIITTRDRGTRAEVLWRHSWIVKDS